MTRVVRVAAGQGFWGDWLEAPFRQVQGGPIDYLMMDYLAEVTMSILQKQKSRDPPSGTPATSFRHGAHSPRPRGEGDSGHSNAGGVNPGPAPRRCWRPPVGWGSEEGSGRSRHG